MAQTTKRADAERNIAAIIAAATDCFARDPDANMTGIAKAAGVGRVTLYAHFPSREAVLRSVLAAAIAESTAVIELAAPDEGPADEAFARLIRTCWPMLSRYGSLHAAAQRALPADDVRRLQDKPMSLVEQLIGRARDEGAFRTDLPIGWQVTTVYALLHAAADEAAAGRLPGEAVGELLTKTLLGALRVGRTGAPTGSCQPDP